MIGIGRGKLNRKRGRAMEHSIRDWSAPRAGGLNCERSGERFADDQPLIRFGDRLVITFGKSEAAGLVEVILGIGKFAGDGGWFCDGAVTACRAGIDEGQKGGLIVGAENQPTV